MDNQLETKPKFYYGWIVVACCFIACLSYGPFYVLGIFFSNLQEEFHWNSALTSTIHSVHLMVFIFSGIFMGWLCDKYGPRLPMLLGAIFIGTGFCLLSRVNSLQEFYIFYGIASLGAGAVFAPPTSTVQKWFVKKSGLALGIVVAGFGAATLIYAPLTEHLISISNWRTAYMQIGAGTACMLMLASFGATTPDKKGLQPYGAELLAKKDSFMPSVIESNWNRNEAVRNKNFWFIAALSICTVLPIHMLIVHLVPFAESIDIEKGVASWAMAIVGGMSIVGRITVPMSIENNIGWRKGLIVVTTILSVTFIWLSQIAALWMLLVFAVFYGFFYGAKVPLIPALIRSSFGTKSLGQITAIINALSLLGGAIGPLLAGYIFDTTDSYTMAFYIGAAFWVLAALFAWLSRPPISNTSVEEAML